MNVPTIICKNCTIEVNDNFCPSCGQKKTTQRYTFNREFIVNQLEAVFQFNKGLLFTIKELLVRPGHAISDYISGKRVRYFNPFSLLLLFVALALFLEKFIPQESTGIIEATSLSQFISNLPYNYPRLSYFIMALLNSVATWIIFKKVRYNLLEHIIINVFIIAGLQILWLTDLIWIFIPDDGMAEMLFDNFQIFISIVYAIWVFYQCFSNKIRTKIGLFTRSIIAPFGWGALTLILLSIIKLLFT